MDEYVVRPRVRPEGRAATASGGHAAAFARYRAGGSRDPLFLHGDARDVLAQLPAGSVDCVMTSPPYWGHRDYTAATTHPGTGTLPVGDAPEIGAEPRPELFVANLLAVIAEVHRVLSDTGSFWLNLGDSYRAKGLQLLPWRVAIAMTDQQGWILRNHVVWHKVKGGPDQAGDKLRNVHEPVLHFVKQARGYHYDIDAIRNRPGTTKVVGGRVVSATGVSGVRYRRRIEGSTELGPTEKQAALAALDEVLADLEAGRLTDFRMVIRGAGRTTHSDSPRVSGRARELEERGFYLLKYHPKGTKPSDVWDVVPEDTHGRVGHYAAYPEDLCRLPVLATCPPDGVVLDPFCGTGTTNRVAASLGRRSVGIEVSADYLELARARAATGA